jgi:hypothetical protein
MRLIAKIAAAALVAAAASPACATDFMGGYTITALNDSDPGLVLNTAPINTNFSFSLNNAGDTASTNLFDLFTNETTVNSDDKNPAKIAVDFTFTLPSALTGTVGGSTEGKSKLFGLVQDGQVTWKGPATIDFGNGGVLQVSLNNATFNKGLFGLNPGENAGADITANFTLVSPSAVPEPATWAMMLAGFGGLGVAMRRSRRKLAATA